MTTDYGLGWHHGVPMDDYLSHPGVSSSILKHFMTAPAIAAAALDRTLPQSESVAAMEGTLIHTALLEPDELADRYMVSGECMARLSSGRNAGEPCGAAGKVVVDGEWRCGRHGKDGENPDRIVVSPDQWHMAMSIRDNALAPSADLYHPGVAAELESATQREVTAFFQDAATGGLGRARLDAYSPTSGTVVDVKTVNAGVGAPDTYARHFWNGKVHVQQGWFRYAAETLDQHNAATVIIVAERQFPFIVQPYIVPEELIRYGQRIAREAMVRLERCRANGAWPGYATTHLDLPILPWQESIIMEAADIYDEE